MINFVKIKEKLMKIKRFLIFMLSALLLVGCTSPQDDAANNDDASSGGVKNTYRQITSDEAAALMDEKNESEYIILDVRRPDEFAAGHIPGAINVPNESIGTDAIPELPDKSQLILVYCRSGRRSKEASEKLVAQGYTNIVEFGGILDWKGEIER